MGAGASTKKKKTGPAPRVYRPGIRGRADGMNAAGAIRKAAEDLTAEEKVTFTQTGRYKKGRERVRKKLIYFVRAKVLLSHDDAEPASEYHQQVGLLLRHAIGEDAGQVAKELTDLRKMHNQEEDISERETLALRGLLNKVNARRQPTTNIGLSRVSRVELWGKDDLAAATGDWKQYIQGAKTAILGGKVCFQVFAGQTGDEIFLGSQIAKPLSWKSLYFAHPWSLALHMGNDFAHRRDPETAPPFDPPLGPRNLMALSLALEQLGGESASKKVPVVCHVPSSMEQMVINDLIEHEYYGLNPETFFVVPQMDLPGYTLDEGAGADRALRQVSSSGAASWGPGYALRQLGWDRQAVKADSTNIHGANEPYRCNGAVIDLLEDIGVEWIVTRRLDDMSLLNTESSVDLGCLATTMKEHKLEGAGASLEVNMRGDKTSGVDFVVAAENSTRWATVWRTEAQSGKESYAALQKVKGDNNGTFPPVNHHRFVFHLQTLDKVLTEQAKVPVMELSPFVSTMGPYLYPSLKVGDIADVAELKAIALVTPKGKYSDLYSHEDIGIMVQNVHKQDSDKGFSNFARHVGYSNQSASELTGLEEEYRNRVLCLVDESEAQGQAILKAAERLMRPDLDFLHIVRATKVKSDRQLTLAQQSMGLYTPGHKRQDVIKTLLTVSDEDDDTPLDRLKRYVKDKNITFCILPQLEDKPGDFTTQCLKNLRVPMAVVKSGHKSLLTAMRPVKEGETEKTELAPLQVGMSPDFHSKPTIDCMLGLIDTRQDYLHFLWPGKKDGQHEEWIRQQRLMVRVDQDCLKFGVKPRSKVVQASKIMQTLVETARADPPWTFACGYLPPALEIPKHIHEMLHKMPCPMFLFKEDTGPSEAAKSGLAAADAAAKAAEEAEEAEVAAEVAKAKEAEEAKK